MVCVVSLGSVNGSLLQLIHIRPGPVDKDDGEAQRCRDTSDTDLHGCCMNDVHTATPELTALVHQSSYSYLDGYCAPLSLYYGHGHGAPFFSWDHEHLHIQML